MPRYAFSLLAVSDILITGRSMFVFTDPIFTLHFKKLPNTKDSEGIVEIEFSTGELGLLGGKGVVFNFKTSSALCHHFGYRFVAIPNTHAYSFADTN